MNAVRSGPRPLVGLLVAVLLASALPMSAVAQDAETTVLPLPGAADLEGHAALVPADAPAPPPAAFDLAAAEEQALRDADRLPAEAWEVDTLAASLGQDHLAALAFVRDRIGLDPYAGVLRGAEGTLAARAGSAADRALLLAALLASQGHTPRYAFGALDGVTADALFGSALAGPRQPLEDVPAAEVLTVDAAALATRARRDHALIVRALDGAFPSGAPAAEGTEPAALRDHVWVQVEMPDGTWLDLDPAAGRDAPGPSLAAPASTAESLPDEIRHAVTLRVVAESLEEGVVVESVVLEESLPAAEAARAEIWLHFQPEVGGLAGSLLEAMAEASWLPVLLVDGEGRAGRAFTLGAGGDGDDFFGDFLGGGGPMLASLRLEVESLSPGRAPVSATRTLYDRVPPSERARGTISADSLEPLPNEGAPAALAALHHVMVSTGGASLRDHAVGRAFAANFAANDLADHDLAAEYALHDLLLPLAVADQTLVVASERLIVEGMADAAVRPFVGRPRVFLSTFSQLPGAESATSLLTDLVLDDLAVVAAPDASPDLAARLRLWYGVLQTALETELALQRAAAVDPDDRQVGSVSLETGDGLDLIAAADAASLPAGAVAARRALADGALVLVAGSAPEPGWFWAIRPQTGLTTSMREPGLRIGFVGGGNYTNASAGGPRWVVDPRTGNTVGHIRDGTFYRYGRKPPTRCSGGPEYVVILGCVSIPASWVTGVTVGATVVAIVAWSAAIIGTLRALR